MLACDATWPRTRLNKTTSSLLIALLVSSTFLSVFTYQKYSVSRLNLALGLSHDSTSYNREFTIELHPENNTRRPPTTVTHDWKITKGYRSPDGVHRLVYLINGTLSLRLQTGFANHLFPQASFPDQRLRPGQVTRWSWPSRISWKTKELLSIGMDCI